MTNFPADIVKAEQLTGGNTNILCALETPTKTKISSSSTTIVTSSDSAKKATPSSSSAAAAVVTPSVSPVASTRKSAAGSYNSSVKVQNTTSSTQKSNDKKLTCTMCNYETDRMNLLMMHIKSHSMQIFSRVNCKQLQSH